MPQRLHSLAGVLGPPRNDAKSPKAAIVTTNPVYAILPEWLLPKGGFDGRDHRHIAVEPAATGADGSHHRPRRRAGPRRAGAAGAARTTRRGARRWRPGGGALTPPGGVFRPALQA